MTAYFHTTAAAEVILCEGFRDATGSYLFANFTLTGVFIADNPMTVNEGAEGDQVLSIEMAADIATTRSSRTASLTGNGAYRLHS